MKRKVPTNGFQALSLKHAIYGSLKIELDLCKKLLSTCTQETEHKFCGIDMNVEDIEISMPNGGKYERENNGNN